MYFIREKRGYLLATYTNKIKVQLLRLLTSIMSGQASAQSNNLDSTAGAGSSQNEHNLIRNKSFRNKILLLFHIMIGKLSLSLN